MIHVFKAASLLTILLMIAPNIGADTPDYADDDGDLATGPVGIEGVSVDSDGRSFRFDLYIDSFDLTQPKSRYWFDLDVEGVVVHWQCIVESIRGVMNMTCELKDQATKTFEQYQRAADRLTLDLPEPVPNPEVREIDARHHLDLKESTIGFTVAYSDLGLDTGDKVTLLEGGASLSEIRKDDQYFPADTIVLSEDVVLG